MLISLVELGDTASLLDGPLVVAIVELSIVVDPVHSRPERDDDLVAPIAGLVQQLGRFGNLEGVMFGHLVARAVHLDLGGECAGVGVD